MASEVLRDIDLNRPMTEQATKFPAAKAADQPTPNDTPSNLCHSPRSHLQDVQQEESAKQTYVSPSDAIMSPASKKLSAFKQKLVDKQGAPKQRSLFQAAMKSRQRDLGPE